MKPITLGLAMCGSFCTYARVLDAFRALADTKRYALVPIMSQASYETDSRFGSASAFRTQLEEICQHEIIHTIEAAEPIGPKKLLDALVIAPCTGNTLAKLACGITDTAVCMAAKAHMRSERPLLIALASNDAISANLGNIGRLLMRKNVFFVPMRQDAPIEKPFSLVADFSLVGRSFAAMREGKQLRPLFN